VYRDSDVYRNLLRLASGLDSLVVGKEEILEEIKTAISNAKLSKTSGNILNKLFDTCIRITTSIRKSTGIGKGLTSIGDIAVKMIEEKVGISGKKVLLIGTGELAAMVAKPLIKEGHKFEVTSMTIERATGFSKQLGGTPIKFEDVISEFNKFDIVIVATTADYFLISYDRIRLVMENKKKGTLILDISDPRAVDEKVSQFPGVKLVFRDQIGEIDEENVKSRKGKIPAVEELISKEVPVIATTMITK